MKRYTLILAGLLITTGVLISGSVFAFNSDTDIENVEFWADEYNRPRISFDVLNNFTFDWNKTASSSSCQYVGDHDNACIIGLNLFDYNVNCYGNGNSGLLKNENELIGIPEGIYHSEFIAGEHYDLFIVGWAVEYDGSFDYPIPLGCEYVETDTFTIGSLIVNFNPDPFASQDLLPIIGASTSVAGILSTINIGLNDLGVIVALLIGLPLGFWAIKKTIGLLRSN